MKKFMCLAAIAVIIPSLVFAERLKVSSLTVNEPERAGKIKAFADVTFNESITVKGIRLIEVSKGMFIGMPSEKKGDRWYDFCYSRDKELSSAIQTAIETKTPEKITDKDKTVAVTRIDIRPYKSSKLKAWVKITLNDSFVINSIKILESKKGDYIEFPSRKAVRNTWEPVVEAVNKKVKDEIEKAVLAEYKKKSSKGK